MTNTHHEKGDITKVQSGVILHQVNVFGIMGAGVARSLADTFPNLEGPYKVHCKRFGVTGNNTWLNLRGEVQFAPVGQDLMVANLFSQRPLEHKYGVLTDYEALRKCLRRIQLSVSSESEIHIPERMSKRCAAR